MIDSKKRHTLKLMGGASLGTASVVSGGSIAASLVSDSLKQSMGTLGSKPSVANGRNELGIQIINSEGVLENTVVFTNHTNATIRLSRFLPATIIYNGKFLNLNSVIPEQGINIKAGQLIAKDLKIEQLSTQSVVEYVWAEHAVETIGHGTELVNLGAFFVDTQAVVFADPEQLVAA